MEGPIYVLVVGGDKAEAACVEEVLADASHASFQVDVVTTYDAALHLAPNSDYGVVLLEHPLGRQTWAQVLHGLRRRGEVPPVLVFTDLGHEEMGDKWLAGGVADVVTKDEMFCVPGLLERAIVYSLRHHKQLRAIADSEEKYRAAVEGSADGVWDWNPASNSLFVSDRFREILGITGAETLDIHAWRSRVDPSHLKEFDSSLRALFEGRVSELNHEHLVLGHALRRWVRVRGTAVRDARGQVCRAAGSLTDIHDEKIAHEQLLRAASHDSLTGTYNRTFLLNTVDNHLQEMRRNPAHSFSVLCVDLDRFKSLNDGLGHPSGDEILCEIARRMSVATEGRGFVSRQGADEFFVVLATGSRETLDVAEALQRAIRHPVALSGAGRRSVTASIGVLNGHPSYRESSEVLRDAGIAMLRAKELGRDRIAMFDEEMREQALRKFHLEQDLLRAILRGDLELRYQPIVSLETGRAVAVETLVRWDHPRYGSVPPAEFVGIAEERGMASRLGEHVVKQVARDIRGWPHTGITVNVNVSPVELSDPGIVGRFRQALVGLPENAVNIEVTETAVVQNEDKAARVLASLREMGVRAHLDDFGTGFASVSHLVKLPLEGVKIDMSLVRHVQDPRYQSAVRAVVSLAHGLGMYTVVEGIETEAQRDVVKKLGADFAQGYLFAHPLSAERVCQWLSRS